MTVFLPANNAASTLAGAANAGATVLTVQAADQAEFPSPAANQFFPVTLFDGAGNMEIVHCTSRSGANLTVTRGQEGTTARAWNSGDSIELRLTKAAIDAKKDVDAVEAIATGGTGANTARQAMDNLFTKGTDVPSATTTDLSAVTGLYVNITGTVNISQFGTANAGIRRILHFTGILTLQHGANIILPEATNIATKAGDVFEFVSDGAGVWRLVSGAGASSGAISLTGAQSTPPGSPPNPSTYLVLPTATGAWNGQDNKLATWNGTTWAFTTPKPNAIYIVDGKMYSTNSSSVPTEVGSKQNYKRFDYTATAGQTVFTGNDLSGNALAYTPGAVECYVNGLQLKTSEITATNGTSITLPAGLRAGDEVSFPAFTTFEVANAVSKGGDTMTGPLNMGANPITNITSLNGGFLNGFRNKIINGDFDIWQRGTSQTTDGYGSADRWANSHSGSTKTVSQQVHTLGQTDVPGSPKYFSRTVVTSVAGASNYVAQIQSIESVLTLAGQTATVTFWAKADAAKDIAVEFAQHFGTGGSPSTRVTGLEVETLTLSTSWQEFSFTVTLPALTGKTLGTNDDDRLEFYFWFDAGSDFDARTGSLGQQSGTFDISHVSIVAGNAVNEDDPFPSRHIQQEIALCQRYYEKGVVRFRGTLTSGSIEQSLIFKNTKRTSPTMTEDGANTIVAQSDVEGVTFQSTSSASGSVSWTADAEL